MAGTQRLEEIIAGMKVYVADDWWNRIAAAPRCVIDNQPNAATGVFNLGKLQKLLFEAGDKIVEVCGFLCVF